MKTFISLSALFLSLSLTAQTNTATWYLNDTSGNGIQSPSNTATGNYSTASGSVSTASGSYSTATGRGTLASGSHSTAMGYYTTAVGPASTALGAYTEASGLHSTAMGMYSKAIGSTSTAMGYFTNAIGLSSTAMGWQTTASGSVSTAMGWETTASDYSSLVVGSFNLLGSTVTNSATQFSTDNTAFVIGNGTGSENRSDALVVKFNGDTTLAGSMTATSFIGDGSQLTNLPLLFSYNSNQAGGIEVANYTTASGSSAFAVGNDNLASGSYSTAMGRGTTASGSKSTAMGQNTIASGDTSTAMGYLTTASGRRSTAMGEETIASGIYSTAMGTYTTAEDFLTFAVGIHNKSDETPNPNEFSYQNTAFVIGNGGYDSNGVYDGTPESYSNAFEVLFDGTTTIAGSMTATSFIGDGSQLTNLPSSGADSPFSYNSNEAGGIEVADYTTASGSRAFAVGNDNLASGSSSTAMGRGTIASGDDSTALGANTEASGLHSTAMGYETNAIGNVSTAMGANTAASGTVSTAMGDTTIANGTVSTAMGGLTTASGNFSTSMGANTAASGHYSTAMGHETQAIGDASTSMGNNTLASGYSSTSMGNNTLASDYASVAIGQYNNSLSSVTTNGSATAYDTDNTALVIGNGVDGDNRSDALVVKFNGDATLAGNLNINSDARLKANIVSIGSTLSKLLKIDGKSYTMKKDESKKQKIGLLAQDIEKVFPELVSESHGVKSVNYQGLVPVLINALKEQDAMMKEQDNRLSKQQSEIDELKTMLKTIIEKT